jgi:hypothetical protein
MTNTTKNLSDKQRAQRGAAGKARMATLTPEQRLQLGRNAYLSGAVNTVIKRIDDLTAEQLDALATAVGSRVLR